ncbi:MAG: hypothetical protein HQK83_07170 [Fibrobacteria bacterium]|nr:hypothetical protein [Fibrobacteria bacterium]
MRIKCKLLFFAQLLFLLSIVQAEDTDLDVVRHPMSIGGSIDFGQAFGIDPNKFYESSNTSNDVVLSTNAVYLIQKMTVNERMDFNFGLVGFYFFPFPQHPTQGRQSFLMGSVSVAAAAGTYSFGDLENPWSQLTIGWQPYKYNRFTKTFGDYLFRTESYPSLIRTGEYGAINNAQASILGAAYNVNLFDGLLKNDFIVNLSTRVPIADISISDVFTLNFGNVFEIGGGIQFNRILPMAPDKTKGVFPRSSQKLNNAYVKWTVQDSLNYENYLNSTVSVDGGKYQANPLKTGEYYWMGKNNFDPDDPMDDVTTAYRNGDTSATGEDLLFDFYQGVERITYQSTKLMGKFGFDVKPLLGDPEIFSPQDLQIYGELSVLGIKDHPIFFDDIMDRMPMMLGFNLPTFGLLDYFTIEIERWTNPWINSYAISSWFTFPIPKNLNGSAEATPELALEQTRDRYENDALLGAASADVQNCVDLESSSSWRNLCNAESELNYSEDDFKWAFTMAKTFKPVTLYLHIANDHFSPIKSTLALSDTELTNRKRSWYYMVKLAVNL